MALEKALLNQLKKFASAFREARDRGTNEADTIMYLVKFFEEVFGYDSLRGEISRELAIKDRFCDLSLKIDGQIRMLVEGKAASVKGLIDKHIEQAENYAARAGVRWVLLTNGIEWKLYHLTFAESEEIAHELAFDANLLDEIEVAPEQLWAKLSLISRPAVEEDLLEGFWSQKKVLSPASIVRALFTQDVLTAVRRELNRISPARLEMQDVFNAIRDALSKESLLEAGDITMAKRRKKRKKIVKTDTTTGQTREEEVEVDDETPDDEAAPSIPFGKSG